MKLDVLHNFHYWYFFLFLIYCSSGRCSITLCQKSKYLRESTLPCFIRILREFSLGEEKKWNRNMPKEQSLISIFLLLFQRFSCVAYRLRGQLWLRQKNNQKRYSMIFLVITQLQFVFALVRLEMSENEIKSKCNKRYITIWLLI